jgi:hypothetical protein
MTDTGSLDVTFPFMVGTDLYPMEHLGGCRAEDGSATRGQVIPMSECRSEGGELIKTVAADGFEAWRFFATHPTFGRLSLTSLDVTYVESYKHIAEDAPLPRDILEGRGSDTYRAVVCHVDVEPAGQIVPADLSDALSRARAGDALIVDAASYTDGCLEKGGGVIDFDDYNLQSPFFTDDSMRAIMDAGIDLLAGNVPSYSDPEGGTGIAMLKLFWQSAGRLILAPLLHLSEVHDDVVTLKVNPWPTDCDACGLPASPVVSAV